MSARLKDNGVFQLWDGLYDDIERCIIAFFSLEDLENLFSISKKFNKMMTKCVYNHNDFQQSVDSAVILPAIKQAITVQYFEYEKEKAAIDHDTEGDATQELQLYIEKEQEMITSINLIISKNITLSKWCLNYLISNQDNLEHFLFTNTPAIRTVFSQLIVTCLKTIKPFELNAIKQFNVKYRLENDEKNAQDETDAIAMDNKKKQNDVDKMKNNTSIEINQVLSLRFIDLLISFIEEIIPQHWYAMESYWSIFEEFIMFDDEYRYYLKNIEFISALGDFYLREHSPYADEIPNKKYRRMGSGLFRPRYSQVIHLISILIRSCHSLATSIRYNKAIEMFNNNKPFDENRKFTNEFKQQLINLFKIPQNSLSYYEKAYSFDDYKCYTLLPLSIRDSKLVNTSAFWNEIIFDARYCKNKKSNHIYGIEILQHWCFNDMKFSKMIIEVLLNKIKEYRNSLHSAGLYACFSMIKTLILMDEDNLLNERFNMLFNCDSQCVGKERIDKTNLKQRLAGGTSTFPQHQYGVTVDLIDVIEFYSEALTKFSFRCIEEIFECIQKNKHFGKLMFEIRHNRWKQWDLRIKMWRSQEIWNDYSSVIESFGVQTQLENVY